MAREKILQVKTLNIDFYPRESHLITFRDPWSFPTLFHPACNQLVRKHMEDLAQKVIVQAAYNLVHSCKSEVLISSIQDSLGMRDIRRVSSHKIL